MSNVIEISYTGDLLAHRRCARAWAYQKYAGFHPYEQVQAMEGRLVHHAMEWLTSFRKDQGRHANRAEAQAQVEHYFRVLWSRGIRTTFASKKDTIDRVLDNLFPYTAQPDTLHRTVQAAVEGALHTEYELRTVKKLVPLNHDGKERLLLTGILDLVVQQQNPLVYERVWECTDPTKLEGKVVTKRLAAQTNDLEIWDYKGSRAESHYLHDYVRQLLTYANLYRERTDRCPKRCILFFLNEKARAEQLLAIPLVDSLLDQALSWTIAQVKALQQTARSYESDPLSVAGGDKLDAVTGARTISTTLKQQCTACGQRFGCDSYEKHLGGPKHPDIDIYNVRKN
jgi:hypothetical protein